MDSFKVLLVDDEEEFRQILGQRLANRGLEIKMAGSGEEGLATLEDFTADVVVMDVRMPGIGGIAALERMKEKRPLTEIIILTGYADTQIAVQVMDLGAFDYLVKPVTIDELIYRLQDAYEKKVLAQ